MRLKDVRSCSTSVADGLSKQIIAEMQRIDPNCLVSFADLNVTIMDAAVFPFLQPAAKEALRRAISARGGIRLVVNSAYRTIAQQYLLFHQKQLNICGRTLVAKPGKSNHERGLALDIDNYKGWKPFLVQRSWRWLGLSDAVHFDFVGGGIRNIPSLSVLAFQKLWNRYNLNDRIPEDGAYGSETERRLGNSPAEGFGGRDVVTGNRVLRLSQPLMQGGDVRRVQEALKRAGFNVNVDGFYGTTTESAVKQFQQQKGLEVDGRIGPATLAALGLSEVRQSIVSPVTVTPSSLGASAFATALDLTLKYEGGFVNHPRDPGGATNKGITQGVYDSFRRGKGLAKQSVQFITDDEVSKIYFDRYWKPSQAELMVLPLAVVQFDTAVLFGVGGKKGYNAIKFLQEALGVTVDGDFGPRTEAALKANNNKQTAMKIIDRRIASHKKRVAERPSQRTFLDGWLNRANNLRNFIENLN